MKIIDISRDILSCEPFGDDPAPRFARAKSIEKGGEYNLGLISMCLHNGTHLDAPLHFIEDGGDINSVDPQAFIGPCAVVEVAEMIITGAFVEEYFPRNAKRILIKSKGKAFLHESAADQLAYLGYELVGTDAPSVEPEEFNGRAHRCLLQNNIAVLENLDLEKVESGNYFLIAPPLKISGAEASPVRAMLISDYIFWGGNNK